MNVYEIVTERIINALSNGVIPWEKPWKAESDSPFPSNFRTGNAYRGINILLLWPGEYASNRWLTFKQALDMGGNVRKGEKGTPSVFYKSLDKDEDTVREDGKESRHFVLRYSAVFNIEQCDGLPITTPEAPRTPVEPIEHCEQIIANWADRPTLQLDNIHQSRAFYRPCTDTVYMPIRDRFVTADHYYATLFHELTHSTGHAKRLNRYEPAAFGDEAYSREELVAEMGSAFLCAVTRIANEHTERNTNAYLQNWIKALRGDSRLIVQAASYAQRAADMICGTLPSPLMER